MTVVEAIKNFNQQFEYEPEIQNQERLLRRKNFIVVGLGGSGLAAQLIKTRNPFFEIIIHQNYGLPALSSAALKNSLIIASSYSGRTEEVIDAFKTAQKKKLSLAVLAIGGPLIDLAKREKIPYIKMPDFGLSPHLALGLSLRALLKITGQDKALLETAQLFNLLKPMEYEEAGRSLAKRLDGFSPIIYASAKNTSLAYCWKIKLNETGKIPAFYNIFPELNHNEISGFDIKEPPGKLARNFYFILLKDPSDHPRILKRFGLLKNLYQEKGLAVEEIELQGNSQFYKIFASLILADWTAYYIAKQYGHKEGETSIIEEFKELLDKSM